MTTPVEMTPNEMMQRRRTDEELNQKKRYCNAN